MCGFLAWGISRIPKAVGNCSLAWTVRNLRWKSLKWERHGKDAAPPPWHSTQHCFCSRNSQQGKHGSGNVVTEVTGLAMVSTILKQLVWQNGLWKTSVTAVAKHRDRGCTDTASNIWWSCSHSPGLWVQESRSGCGRGPTHYPEWFRSNIFVTCTHNLYTSDLEVSVPQEGDAHTRRHNS